MYYEYLYRKKGCIQDDSPVMTDNAISRIWLKDTILRIMLCEAKKQNTRYLRLMMFLNWKEIEVTCEDV